MSTKYYKSGQTAHCYKIITMSWDFIKLIVIVTIWAGEVKQALPMFFYWTSYLIVFSSFHSIMCGINSLVLHFADLIGRANIKVTTVRCDLYITYVDVGWFYSAKETTTIYVYDILWLYSFMRYHLHTYRYVIDRIFDDDKWSYSLKSVIVFRQ